MPAYRQPKTHRPLEGTDMALAAHPTERSAEAGIHRISRLGIVNEYLVAEDDGLTLIDTGLAGTHRLILARAAVLGMPIVRIALTHAHRDHCGSLDALAAALPGVQVIASEREAPLLAGNTGLREGEPAGPLRGGFRAAATRPARLVGDGDTIGSLRVLATPGHTPGHLAFFDTRDGTLYAGDAFTTTRGVATSAVVPWRYPMAGLATWNRGLDLNSARRLRHLHPARLASGHGPVIEAPAPAMTRAITTAARKIERTPNPAAAPGH
jgi:glyoxylase-like metal-dependent hydrolase (beta-lactamase superfamily II)